MMKPLSERTAVFYFSLFCRTTKKRMSLRGAKRRGNLLLDFVNDLQEIAASGEPCSPSSQ